MIDHESETLDCVAYVDYYKLKLENDKLKAQSGFNRNDALDRIGQDCYFFDVYKFESKYWEIVARNQSNHHSNPQLSQKWTDYVKEVCNAVDSDVIMGDSKSIDEFFPT